MSLLYVATDLADGGQGDMPGSHIFIEKVSSVEPQVVMCQDGTCLRRPSDALQRPCPNAVTCQWDDLARTLHVGTLLASPQSMSALSQFLPAPDKNLANRPVAVGSYRLSAPRDFTSSSSSSSSMEDGVVQELRVG